MSWYKQVELVEGRPVVYVGCHVVKWWDVASGQPDVGFVPDEAPALLLAALEAVEWVHGVCPWCGNCAPTQYVGPDGGYDMAGGHLSDCPRQLAIKKAKGE